MAELIERVGGVSADRPLQLLPAACQLSSPARCEGVANLPTDRRAGPDREICTLVLYREQREDMRTRLCNAAARQLTRHRSVVTEPEMQEVRIVVKCSSFILTRQLVRMCRTCTEPARPGWRDRGPLARDTT